MVPLLFVPFWEELDELTFVIYFSYLSFWKITQKVENGSTFFRPFLRGVELGVSVSQVLHFHIIPHVSHPTTQNKKINVSHHSTHKIKKTNVSHHPTQNSKFFMWVFPGLSQTKIGDVSLKFWSMATDLWGRPTPTHFLKYWIFTYYIFSF